MPTILGQSPQAAINYFQVIFQPLLAIIQVAAEGTFFVKVNKGNRDLDHVQLQADGLHQSSRGMA